MSRRVSLPAEHGGYLTAAAAGGAAALVAPDPWRALAVGTTIVAAFLSRGVLDRLAVGRAPAAWDRAWLALLASAALGASAVLAPRDAMLTGGMCVGLVLASVVVRRTRHHRDAGIEAAGMALLGASAGWAALSAGASSRDAVCVGLVLAAHAALAVPLVRTQVRRRERAGAGRAVRQVAAILVVLAALLVLLGRPLVAFALAPRALQTGLAAWRGHVASSAHVSATGVGVRETLALVTAVALLVLTLRS